MLEQSRKQGASIFIYLIFGLLIVIFVINFNPGAGGRQGEGCSGTDNTVVRVDGKDVTQTAYHVAYANPYNRGTGKQHTHVALEMLIRRELLAQEAERRGLSVTTDLVQEEIKKGHFFLGGQTAQIPGIFDEDGIWRLQAFKNWIGQLNVSRNSYVTEQARSMLATMMSKILAESVQVSRDEALQHFLFEGNTVMYDVVAFRPENYAKAMKLTDADVDRFISTHGAEVEARYKADERTYKGVKPQLKLRQIFIAKQEAEKPAAPTQGAGSGAGSGSAAGSGVGSAAPKTEEKKPAVAKVGMPIEEAKKKLEVARADIAGGKLKFADAAKQLNTDENFKANGGELGWRTADNASLGDKAVSDAVKALKPGEMTPVITTDNGAYLVIAEEKREGDLSYDAVKHEIAKDLAREVWGKEAAKRAAIVALEKARAGVGLNLDQLYEKEKTEAPPGNVDIQKIINDPNMSDEDKQRLLQMLLQGQKSGAMVVESKDKLAAWYADDNGSSGSATAAGSAAASKAAGSAAAPAPGSAAPKAPAAGSAAPPKAPASGSAAAAPAAGSAAAGSAAAGSAAGLVVAPATGAAPAAPPAPAAAITPSNDVLPQFGEVQKPTVARFGPSPRSAMMSGIGSSKEAAAALFDELSPGMLAKQVYEGDGGYAVVQLITRADPNTTEFDKDADRLVEELRQARAQAFVEEWMKERCEKLVKDGRITPNAGLVRETDDTGKLLPVTYKPCMSFQSR